MVFRPFRARGQLLVNPVVPHFAVLRASPLATLYRAAGAGRPKFVVRPDATALRTDFMTI